jgi:FG-GAP-like repeat/FG-GAP repeat
MGTKRAPALMSAAALLVGLAGCGHDDYYYYAPGGSGSGNTVGYTPNSIAIADINGDGVPDLLVATTIDQYQNNNPGFAGVYLGVTSAPGTYQAGVQYSTTGTNPSGIVVVDLTNSGSKDMVVSNFGSGTASVFMHNPAAAGTFLAAVTLTTGGQPNQVVSADINGDGLPDLVFADMSGNAIVMLQNASSPGQFEAPLSLATSGQTASVAIADVNGDGKPDIVATVYDNNGNNGAVLVFIQSTSTPGTFNTPVSYPAGAQPEAVRIADVNGDGLPDLVVANYGPGSDGTGTSGVSVLLQSSATAGTFLAPVSYPTPWGPVDVAVGDLNGDGKPDLVVASVGPEPTGAVSVLLQSSTTAGTFDAAEVYQGYGQPLSVAIADLNGDGHPDIAVADGYNATVMLQNAASLGTFSGPTPVN